MSASYPSPARRSALAPAILATIALLIGVALVDSDGFIIIRYAVSILALIVAVFAWQAGQWWWLFGLVPIAVVWNPVLPVELSTIGGSDDLWLALQYIAAAVFLATGILVRTSSERA